MIFLRYINLIHIPPSIISVKFVVSIRTINAVQIQVFFHTISLAWKELTRSILARCPLPMESTMFQIAQLGEPPDNSGNRTAQNCALGSRHTCGVPATAYLKRQVFL